MDLHSTPDYLTREPNYCSDCLTAIETGSEICEYCVKHYREEEQKDLSIQEMEIE